MKKLNLIFALLLFITFPAFAAYDVKQSGKAWYLADESLPIISIKLSFKNSGYAHDPKGKLGLAYFVSGMLNEGAGEYDAKTFQKLLDENAIGFSARADADRFYIEVKTISENLGLTLRLLNAALTQPHFAEQELATVRGQILTIIAKNDESPGKIAKQKLASEIFADYPYANAQEGSTQSVNALTAQDMHSFVQQHLTKDNLNIVIVGDVSEKKVKRILSIITHKMPSKGKLNDLPEFAAYPQGFDSKQEIANPQTIVMFTSKGIKRSDPDFYAAYILNHIIGGSGFQSRLYKELREERGLTYYVGTDFLTYDKAEIMLGTLATTTDQVKEAKEIVRQTLRELAQDGVSQEELSDAKSYMTGSFPLNLDTNSKIASYLLMMQTQGLDINYLKNRNNYINSVTLEQINSLAKKLISAEKLGFVTVGQ